MKNLKVVRLNIQLTKKCNQRCQSCNSYELDATNEMTTEEIMHVIKEICNVYDIKNIAFTGGEPTLHKDILQIAECAAQYSPNVSVTTNGYYCTTRERVKELISSGINRYSFSYHGIGRQDEFCGVLGSEARIRQALEWLVEEREKDSNIYIKIGTLFNGNNIDEVEKVLDYAESKNVDTYIEILDHKILVFKNSKLSKSYKNIEEKTLEAALAKIKEWKKYGRKVLIDEKGLEFIRLWLMGQKIGGVSAWLDGHLCGKQWGHQDRLLVT